MCVVSALVLREEKNEIEHDQARVQTWVMMLQPKQARIWWILHWDTEEIKPTREETPVSYGLGP